MGLVYLKTAGAGAAWLRESLNIQDNLEKYFRMVQARQQQDHELPQLELCCWASFLLSYRLTLTWGACSREISFPAVNFVHYFVLQTLQELSSMEKTVCDSRQRLVTMEMLVTSWKYIVIVVLKIFVT